MSDVAQDEQDPNRGVKALGAGVLVFLLVPCPIGSLIIAAKVVESMLKDDK